MSRHLTFSSALQLLIGLIALSLSTLALAHAHPQTRSPAKNATLTHSPNQVAIQYTEALEPAFSYLKVINQAGKSVTLNDSLVPKAHHNTMKVTLKPHLTAGHYTVKWKAVSVDGHTTQGNYTFQVTTQ